MKLTVPAPAKLNLFLHVVGRRSDGYHELQTAFQILDRGDALELVRRDDGRLRLLGGRQGGVALADNLVLRAARALQVASACRYGVDIRLHKYLPVGAGLGGGSSDAASTLVALNALWGLRWSRVDLAALGLRLGADVPLFIHGQSAFAEGVGERLTPLRLPAAWYCVVTPDCAVSTASIFAAPELTRNTPATTISAFVAAPADHRNDCWPVVAQRYPPVLKAFQWLSQFGIPRLTGTGSSVFLPMSSRQAALAVAAQLPPPWRALVARGVSRSALAGALRQQ